MFRAVLTGDKAEMDEKTEQLYIQAGIVHVLAISGLHISIIGMSVYTLLKRLGVGLKGSACLSGFIVLSYGVMTGFGPSNRTGSHLCFLYEWELFTWGVLMIFFLHSVFQH